MSVLLMTRRAGGAAAAGASVANYAALSDAALTQEPNWAFYVTNVRSAAAGTAYTDPVSGRRVVKLTDSTTPSANSGIRNDYASGGPFISQPWGTNGDSVTVWANGMGLCDITRGGTPTNYRNPVAAGGELRFGFSRNPATPRRAYVLGLDGYVRRINTETNTLDAGDGFPYDLTTYAGASYPLWITISENDSTIACFINDESYAIAIQPATQTVSVKSLAAINAVNGNNGLNEAYVSADGRYVMIASNGVDGTCIWDLVTGFISGGFSVSGQGQQMAHTTTMGGSRFVSSDAYGSRATAAAFTAVPVTANGQAFPTVSSVMARSDTSVSFAHNNSYQVGPSTLATRYVVGQTGKSYEMNGDAALRGSWSVHSGQIYKAELTSTSYGVQVRGVNHVFRRATASSTAAVSATVRRATSIGDMTEDSWFWDSGTVTLYLWQLGGGSPDARYGAVLPDSGMPSLSIGAFRADGVERKFIAHHYSHIDPSTDYNSFAFCQQSYDGKWLLFSTNHGVPSGRNDLMILELPVT
jgi:hypothetical protein